MLHFTSLLSRFVTLRWPSVLPILHFFVSVMNITLSPTTYNWVLITCDNRCQHCFSYQWRDGCGHEDTSSCFLASAVLSTQVGILIATIHTEDTTHIHIWTSLKCPPVFLQVLSVCHESICMTLEAIVLLKPLHAFFFFKAKKCLSVPDKTDCDL